MFEEIAGEILLGRTFWTLTCSPVTPMRVGLKKEISQYMSNEVRTGRHLNNKLRFRHQYLPRKSRFGIPFKVCL